MIKKYIGSLILFAALLVFSCNTGASDLNIENKELKKEIDSLKNELYKCNLLIESYEGMPLNI